MKHSVRAQQKCYDERPLTQKKERALDLLNSVASRSLNEDEPEIVSYEDQEGYLDCLPVPGDFVALVTANSTKKIPEVFVAKILRLSEDQKKLLILPILRKKSQEDLNRKREKVIKKIQVL